MVGYDTGAKSKHCTRTRIPARTGFSKHDFDQARGKISKKMCAAGKPLNQEQQDILSNAWFSKNGFKLIMGPPGCGKTTLIAMLADLFLRALDVAVLVLASSNGSTDQAFESLGKWMCEDANLDPRIRPLHVHKKYAEFKYFLSEFDPVGTEARKQSSEKRSTRILNRATQTRQRSFYEQQQHAEKVKHLSDEKSGVAATVLKALQIAESGLSVLQGYHSRLRRGFLEGLWGNGESAVREAFDKVARYIIGTKRLVVSTVGNATSAILQDCIFRDARYVIVVMDEAGLATDTDLIHILAGLITAERVSDEFDGVNPIVHVELIGDHKQGSPLVKSDIAKANVFGPQLATSHFVRFALSGFPLDHLWEQHRMVKSLCELPSKRVYDGKLRTSNEALSRRMTLHQQNQHLQHWLLDVGEGSTEKDSALRDSRFNVANVDVTLRFLKALLTSRFLPLDQIRILTFYRAQRQRYVSGIQALQQELGLTQAQLDNVVHTSDFFQGREATCIILDLVVTEYRGREFLGHAGDEKKVNVAFTFTRARDFLFVVGNSTILDAEYQDEKGGWLPFIFESMEGLLGRKAVTRCYLKKSPESVLTSRFNKLSTKGDDEDANLIRANEVD
ncbi:hypothetical protein GJ744_012312 [Endocarpon pusillum]|uniref:AAA+ ATPase domain-containing protein n=1 Tax=Endocarpon pusillum TaxID=364733 RepID=A0A8H7E282_9EURO|nr:hypothetical protein GJ744_012312 [Endocarpon pusillum]